MNVSVAGVAGSIEQNTTRWAIDLSQEEEVDATNPDGIALLLQWNSSEKDVLHTVSKVQRCLSATIWVKGVCHIQMWHTVGKVGQMRFCCMSLALFAIMTSLNPPPLSLLAFSQAASSSVEILGPSAYPLDSMHIVQQHSA